MTGRSWLLLCSCVVVLLCCCVCAQWVLCRSIIGGAVLTPLMGLLADLVSINVAYTVPMASYVCVTLYAFSERGRRRNICKQTQSGTAAQELALGTGTLDDPQETAGLIHDAEQEAVLQGMDAECDTNYALPGPLREGEIAASGFHTIQRQAVTVGRGAPDAASDRALLLNDD